MGTLGVWCSAAALTTCLNETPAFARLYASAAPDVVNVARGVLGLLSNVVPRLVGADATCAPSALAWTLAAASGLFVAAILVLEYTRVRQSTAALIVVGVWLVSHAVLFAMPALLSTDVLDYASYGRIAALYGADPYVTAPSMLPNDALAGFGGWESPTVYGPLWTHVDAALAQLFPVGDPLQLVFAYKVVASFAQAASLALVWWLTGQWTAMGALRSPRVAAFALFAWNPLALFELSGNAHNEALMLTAVLLAFALLTLAVRQRRRLASQALWVGALGAIGLGVLVKFVPAAVGLVVGIVWLRRLPNLRQRLVLGALASVILVGLALVVSWPWLDSSDMLRPLLGILRGGERFRYAWQDSPADILKIKFIVPRMPDVHDSLRTDLARNIVWGVTRVAFLVVLGVSIWRLARRRPEDGPTTLRTIASASAWLVLAATLLLLTQVLAWYFLWTLPMVALLGWRSRVARVAVLFGLSFQCAFYLGELQSFGTAYLAVYAIAALALLAAAEALTAVLGARGAPTTLPPVTAAQRPG